MKKFLTILLLLTAYPLSGAAEQMTGSDWRMLSEDEQVDMIHGDAVSRYSNLDHYAFSVTDAHLALAGHQVPVLGLKVTMLAAVERAMARMTSRVDWNIDPSPHATVGPVYLYWLDILVLDNLEVLGLRLGYIQDGCDYERAGSGLFRAAPLPHHFATAEDAAAAGCHDNDVSWQAHGVFSGKRILQLNDQLTWSGH